MLLLLITAIGAVGLTAGWIFWKHWEAFVFLREALHELALGGSRTVLFPKAPRVWKSLGRDLRLISERFQEQSRKLAEEDLSMRLILSSMAEGVLLVDARGVVRMANPAMLHYSDGQELVGRRVSEVLGVRELAAALRETLRDGQRRQLEFEMRFEGEKPQPSKWMQVALSAIQHERSPVVRGAILVFHDITRLKEIEVTRREFVANVSHEFRTPLAVIGGYVETLAEGGIEDREFTSKALEAIRRHCHGLNMLIEDLLVISRLEHGKEPLNFERVEMGELFGRVLEFHAEQISEARAEMQIEVEAGAEWVEGDAWRLEHAVSNLVQNALRYGSMEGEPPRITLAARKVGERVEIACRDQGPGIPLSDQPHIFERFYRVHKDRSRNAGGTGLGLSIVKNIALAHGGEAHVESTPGDGAKFAILLPQKNPGVPPLARQFYTGGAVGRAQQ